MKRLLECENGENEERMHTLYYVTVIISNVPANRMKAELQESVPGPADGFVALCLFENGTASQGPKICSVVARASYLAGAEKRIRR